MRLAPVRLRAIGALLGSALFVAGLAGCGGDGGEADAAAGPCDVQVTGEAGKKPTVTVPDGCDPPTELKSRDVSAGSGPAAKAGDAVEVNYVGIAWSTKKQFDSSWAPGRKPYVVQPLGQASVIQGWNQGLVGTKAGMRRVLVIPANLAYGNQQKGPDIKPGETLVFVVDIVSVKG